MIAALLLAPDAMSQGLGMGAGIDDARPAPAKRQTGWSSTCGDTIPAPASTWGYTQELCLNNIAQIDVNNTGNAGYGLYPRIGWPGLASGNTATQTQSPTPGSWYTAAAGGGFQILTTGTSGNPGIDLESCITNGNAGQWIGNTFSGGMYVKIVVGSTASGMQVDGWWSVFWMEPTEYLAAASPGPASFTETDVQEMLSTHVNMIGWTPSPTWNSPVHSFVDQFQFDPGGTHTNQTYAALIVPPALNGGTGLVEGFTNDVLTTTTPNTITFISTDQIAQVLTQHNCIAVTGGSGNPFVIRSIQVWQAPTTPCAGNLNFDGSDVTGCHFYAVSAFH